MFECRPLHERLLGTTKRKEKACQMKTIKLVVALISIWLALAAAVVHAQTNVRIAFNGFGGTAPLFVGQEAGIFKKQGLNLELVFIPGGSLSLQALLGKSLDLLMTGGPPVLNAYLQGAKIKIIAGVTNLLPYTFVVGTGIRTAEQVKGKKIGISRFGSNTDYVVRLALNQFALAPMRFRLSRSAAHKLGWWLCNRAPFRPRFSAPRKPWWRRKWVLACSSILLKRALSFPT